MNRSQDEMDPLPHAWWWRCRRLIVWWRNLPGVPFRLALRYVSWTLRRDEGVRCAWHCGLACMISGGMGGRRARSNMVAARIMAELMEAPVDGDKFYEPWRVIDEAERNANALQESGLFSKKAWDDLSKANGLGGPSHGSPAAPL